MPSPTISPLPGGGLSIRGTTGPDLLGGTLLGDSIVGGLGNDTIVGSPRPADWFEVDLTTLIFGHDTIYGGAGDDWIRDGIGNDLIYGGPGYDRIFDGAGDDTIYLGADGGVIYYDGFENTMVSSMLGSEGHGTYFGASGSNPFDSVLSFQQQDFRVVLTRLDEFQFRTEQSENLRLFNIDIIIGTQMNDAYTGYWGNDIFFGAGGDDELFGGDGFDQFNGGTGNDTLAGGAGSDLLLGASGDDRFDTDDMGDSDTVYGGSGNDTIESAYGYDRFSGGEGDDSISAPGGGYNFIAGGAGSDTIIASIEGFDTINGGDGDDSITLYAAQATVQGGAGNDTIDGYAASPDWTTGRVLSGGDGDDWISSSNPLDIIRDGAGTDTVELYAGGKITGNGDAGDLYLDYGYFEDGATSTLTFAHLQTGVNALATGSVDSFYSSYAGFKKIIGTSFGDWFDGIYHDGTIHAGAGDDSIIAYIESDTVLPSDRIGRLFLGDGNDSIITNEEGTFYVYGGAGFDVFEGGIGNDRFDGGEGFSYMTGGANADVFSFATHAGQEEVYITDFEDGVDRIMIKATGDIPNFDALKLLAFDESGELGVITNAGDSLRIEGFSLAQFDASDMIFV